MARATGLRHVAGATGRTSELAVQRHHALPEQALIDMGDFVGGMLKYLRAHPVERITVAGGVAKMTKLAQGRLDLHSKRGEVDLAALAEVAHGIGAPAVLAARIAGANTAAEAFGHAATAGVALGDAVAQHAWQTAAGALDGAAVALDVLLFDRQGLLAGATPATAVHESAPGITCGGTYGGSPDRTARCRGTRRGPAPAPPAPWPSARQGLAPTWRRCRPACRAPQAAPARSRGRRLRPGIRRHTAG